MSCQTIIQHDAPLLGMPHDRWHEGLPPATPRHGLGADDPDAQAMGCCTCHAHEQPMPRAPRAIAQVAEVRTHARPVDGTRSRPQQLGVPAT